MNFFIFLTYIPPTGSKLHYTKGDGWRQYPDTWFLLNEAVIVVWNFDSKLTDFPFIIFHPCPNVYITGCSLLMTCFCSFFARYLWRISKHYFPKLIFKWLSIPKLTCNKFSQRTDSLKPRNFSICTRRGNCSYH